MLGFVMWSAAYAAAGFEIVRIFSRMHQAEEQAAAFEPERPAAGASVRRIRASRPGHIDLTETDLRK